jgi:FAD dependent oxidoreductase
LFMAGRNISASYVAFTSARVMATCAVEGQAIGTAAALCVEGGIAPRELAHDANQVERLQETLLRDDQTIKGRRNRDPLDLAREASVNASAEEGNAKAELVLDGFTRDIPDAHGEPMVIHHWAAPVAAGQTAWIELRWSKPQHLREVQLTFDSGFRRQLTLSAQETQNINLLRAPQPETVRDYVIHCHTPAGDRRIASVAGNFQRLNRHRFDPLEVQALRVEVHATNGDRLARIFEIRCYG